MMITLLVIGGLNTALSLFYYLRVVKVMTFEPEPEQRPPFTFSAGVAARGLYRGDHRPGVVLGFVVE